MKNILLWVGIVALSLQDYFKKQPIKPTRSQQFFQIGGTAQAFIAGTTKVKCKCGWTWKLSDGGNDPYVCHKCGYDNSTAFIAGTITNLKKMLTYYFGKPTKTIKKYAIYNYKIYNKTSQIEELKYKFKAKDIYIDLIVYKNNLSNFIEHISIYNNDDDKSNYPIYEGNEKYILKKSMTYLLILLEELYKNEERYIQLTDLAQAGNWELALEIAKGQGLL